MKKFIAHIIRSLTNGAAKIGRVFIDDKKLREYKPIHLCWWFLENGFEIPDYFIAGMPEPPQVQTDQEASEITNTSISIGGTVVNEGVGSPVHEKGICWIQGLSGTPTIDDNTVFIEEGGTGPFGPLTADGLQGSTTYRFRAYAINEAGTGYGFLRQITTAPDNEPPTIALNSPDNHAELEEIPRLEFTGQDAEDDDLEYEIEIYDLDDYEEIPLYTPGTQHVNWVEGYASNNGQVLFLADHVRVEAWNAGVRTIVTDDAINFDDITGVRMHSAQNLTDIGTERHLAVGEKDGARSNDAVASDFSTSSNQPEHHVDTSEISGNHYVRAAAYYFSLETYFMSVFEIVLEKGDPDGTLIIEANSGQDPGFENIDTPADNSPFNAGDRIGYTPDIDGGSYKWRVRVRDPNGSGEWSNWSDFRIFTVEVDEGDPPNTGAASFSGAGEFNPIGEMPDVEINEGSANFAGAGEINAFGEMPAPDLNEGAADFSGAGAFAPFGVMPLVLPNIGFSEFSGSGDIQPFGQAIFSGHISLGASGQIEAFGEMPEIDINEGSGEFSAAAEFNPVGTQPAVDLNVGFSTFSSAGDIEFFGQAVFSGNSIFDAAGEFNPIGQMPAVGDAQGLAEFAGKGQIVFNGASPEIDINEGSSEFSNAGDFLAFGSAIFGGHSDFSAPAVFISFGSAPGIDINEGAAEFSAMPQIQVFGKAVFSGHVNFSAAAQIQIFGESPGVQINVGFADFSGTAEINPFGLIETKGGANFSGRPEINPSGLIEAFGFTEFSGTASFNAFGEMPIVMPNVGHVEFSGAGEINIFGEIPGVDLNIGFAEFSARPAFQPIAAELKAPTVIRLQSTIISELKRSSKIELSILKSTIKSILKR